MKNFKDCGFLVLYQTHGKHLELHYQTRHQMMLFSLEFIDDNYRTFRAEEIPEEEKNLGPLDFTIQVYHFTKGVYQNQETRSFGEPFFLVIQKGETMAKVKIRIQK